MLGLSQGLERKGPGCERYFNGVDQRSCFKFEQRFQSMSPGGRALFFSLYVDANEASRSPNSCLQLAATCLLLLHRYMHSTLRDRWSAFSHPSLNS
ncbi:hypothetical protein MPTK1_7g05030 [Marchantia polymorpha subsp. ruderalis]|uniref:Uncharacterized protein n=2 Tax=Marchantia polymorpha TaxID=3197 RepID=A0AAF6BWA1_MARPO|nr:hypothetical protein MARPO_0062s0023 [Marchantia polymorpha]BBN16285.1 hypothetical protein Mp_7g05030 [Marchantia polymorpha subsp. ruderalis]|eukprot:PTQ36597.1 hypothetical protein MARPO_0062s0023 [Marchantia polymorpha]